MLDREPKVGDIIKYTEGSAFGVWQVTSITAEGRLYGNCIRLQTGEEHTLLHQLLMPWEDSNWSIDFSEWVKQVRRNAGVDHSDESV